MIVRFSTTVSKWIATLLLPAALVLLAGAPQTGSAQSPTPTMTVENGNGDVRLQSFFDGGVLMPGTYDPQTPNDSIPAEGPGTRMMWYPAKAAFRAGRVGVFTEGNDIWNADSTGVYSVALGVGVKATKYASVALGQFNEATGGGALAMGRNTDATAKTSTSFGFNTRATAGQATALGQGTVASGEHATAMGRDTEASARNATAMGKETTASGQNATAMGLNAEASRKNATAMGNGSFAAGSAATAMGAGDATGEVATAMGTGTANAEYATAMGRNTTASGERATAMGAFSQAEGNSATAMGNSAVASGDYATAMGLETEAATNHSLTIGRLNDANSFFNTNYLFVAGNGSDGNRSDALVLFRNGDLEISGTLTESSDRRLKTGIEPLGENVLGKLRELRPVRFEFKNQRTHPSGRQIGLIAQDVRKEFPALVSNGADGMLSLAYPKLTAVLLKGLQEQQVALDERESQISSLRVENKQIKKRLAALETKIERSTAYLAGLTGPWGIGLLIALGLGGLGGTLLARRRT